MGHLDRSVAVGTRAENDASGAFSRLFDGGQLRIGEADGSEARDVDRAAVGEPRLHDDLLAVAGRVEPNGWGIDIDGNRFAGLESCRDEAGECRTAEGKPLQRRPP